MNKKGIGLVMGVLWQVSRMYGMHGGHYSDVDIYHSIKSSSYSMPHQGHGQWFGSAPMLYPQPQQQPVSIVFNASSLQSNDQKLASKQRQESEQQLAYQQLQRLVHEQKQLNDQQQKAAQRLAHASQQVSEQKHVHEQFHALLNEQRQANTQTQEAWQHFVNEQRQITQQSQEALQRVATDLQQICDQLQNQHQRQAQLQDQLMAQKTVVAVPTEPRGQGLSRFQWCALGSCWLLSCCGLYYYLTARKKNSEHALDKCTPARKRRPACLPSSIDKEWLMYHFYRLKNGNQQGLVA